MVRVRVTCTIHTCVDGVGSHIAYVSYYCWREFLCVCLCSPGLNMSKKTDAKVIEHCSDADIFVYVCNGITTFETTVSLCMSIPHASLPR